MEPLMKSLPDRPLTRAEVRAIHAAAEIKCPTLWTRSTGSQEKVVALFLIVDQTLHRLSYEAGWTKRVVTDHVTDLESFTAVELASHALIKDKLDVPDEQFTMYRNDPSRPVQ